MGPPTTYSYLLPATSEPVRNSGTTYNVGGPLQPQRPRAGRALCEDGRRRVSFKFYFVLVPSLLSYSRPPVLGYASQTSATLGGEWCWARLGASATTACNVNLGAVESAVHRLTKVWDLTCRTEKSMSSFTA